MGRRRKLSFSRASRGSSPALRKDDFPAPGPPISTNTPPRRPRARLRRLSSASMSALSRPKNTPASAAASVLSSSVAGTAPFLLRRPIERHRIDARISKRRLELHQPFRGETDCARFVDSGGERYDGADRANPGGKLFDSGSVDRRADARACLFCEQAGADSAVLHPRATLWKAGTARRNRSPRCLRIPDTVTLPLGRPSTSQPFSFNQARSA